MDTKTRLVLLGLCWLWLFALFSGLNAAMHFLPPGILFFGLIFFLLIDVVFPSWGVLIKVLITLILIHRNYYIGSFFDPAWLGWLASDVISDLRALQGLHDTVLPVTAMFISLVSIALAQKVCFALVSRGKGALFLLFLGCALLTGVYMLTGEDVTRHTIFFAIFGLLVMGTSKLRVRFSFPMARWLGVLLVWVLVITSVAWALPDGNLELSQWWEEVLTWRIKGKGGKGKVGYGKYVGALGEPLVLDDTPYLQVTSPHPVYLRGEVRYIYTGHTWEAPHVDTNLFYKYFYNEFLPEGEEAAITVEFLQGGGQALFVPRTPTEITFSSRGDGTGDNPILINHRRFSLDFISLSMSKPVQAGDSYTITAVLPYDDPEYLRGLTSTAMEEYHYYQLPAGLGSRVFELAYTITEGADTSYDKAAAITRYLRRGRWKYSLDTEYPPEDMDFVEWFLFEADRGYCVHFSTAFVVLARAAGLPARWVRGYSAGIRDSEDTFTILNQHAHAWAEVWFDGYGWVPFEPTPGSSLPTFGQQESESPENPEEPNDEPTTPQDPALPDPGIVRPQDPGNPGQEEPAGNFLLTIALLAAALLGLMAMVLLRNRKVGAVKLYAKLQARLRLFGWQRKEWETAREHMDRVEELPDRQAYASFVNSFEEAAYGGQVEKKEVERKLLGKSYSLLNLAWHRIVCRR